MYPKAMTILTPFHLPGMCIKMTQHPVGRGGLFSGCACTGRRGIRWVYDCGSIQTAELDKEIKNVKSEGDVDVLFISHLDDDHVNGMDKLLELYKRCGRPIKTVIIPYFDDNISIGIMAKSGAKKPLTETFIQMNRNITEWFQNRGVKRIVYVDSDSDSGPVDPMVDPDDDEERQGPTIWLDGQDIPDQDPSAPIAEYYKADANVQASICSKNGAHSFILIPYAHKPDRFRMARFTSELIRFFGTSDANVVVYAAKSIIGRKILKSCYEKIWADHNYVSMSLYCGLASRASLRNFILKKNGFSESVASVGWVLTGDSNLNGMNRRNKFFSYYRHYIPNVNLMMLPHHGSDGSYHPDILSKFRNVQLFYATAEPGAVKFPHPNVRKHLFGAKRQYRTVGTKSYSRITLKGYVW